MIFLLFVEPLLKLLGNLIFVIADKLFKSVSNSLYTSVGQERYDLDFVIALYIFVLFFSCVMVIYLKIILDSKNLLDKSKRSIFKLKNEVLDNHVYDIKDIENKLKKIYRKSIIIGVVFGVFFILNASAILAIQMTIKDKVYLYKNTKIIVAPYIDKLDLDVIDSKFPSNTIQRRI